MQGPTHMAGGAAAAAAYVIATQTQMQMPPILAVAAMGVGMVGGLIPDIDHPNSKISKSCKPVSALVSLIFSHRGLFHTPFLYLILWGIWMWLCPNPEWLIWGNLVFLGIASHLFLDFLNPGGIPILFPIESKRRRLLRIKTGSKTELVIRWLLILCCAALLIIQIF